MARFFVVLLASVLLFTSAYAEESTLAKGKALVEKECSGCHGPDGRSEVNTIPSIGGFSETAILDLLETYKKYGRPATEVRLEDGTESDMKEVVKSVSDSDLRLAAKYYASLEWQPNKQEFDSNLARRGSRVHGVKCGKCHLREGSIPESDHALLSGQWREYLEQQFADFDSRARRMSSKMQQKYDTLSEEDKAALLELYASAGRYR